MPLTRAKKTEKISHLAADLEKSTSAIVGTFAGLTASKDFELRKTVRAAGGSYHVVKNKLAARAGEGTKIEAALKGLKGVSSVAYTSGDRRRRRSPRPCPPGSRTTRSSPSSSASSTARSSPFRRSPNSPACPARKSSSRSSSSSFSPRRSAWRLSSTPPAAISQSSSTRASRRASLPARQLLSPPQLPLNRSGSPSQRRGPSGGDPDN